MSDDPHSLELSFRWVLYEPIDGVYSAIRHTILRTDTGMEYTPSDITWSGSDIEVFRNQRHLDGCHRMQCEPVDGPNAIEAWVKNDF